MLTDKEREEINNLKVGFNIVKEHTDPLVVASRRVEISRRWSRKMLVFSFWLNILSIACFVVAFILTALKPLPDYYASTPSGKIYGPLHKLKIK